MFIKKIFFIVSVFLLFACSDPNSKPITVIVNNVNKNVCKSGSLAYHFSPDPQNYSSTTKIYSNTKTCTDLGLIEDGKQCSEHDLSNYKEHGDYTCVIKYEKNLLEVHN